MTRPVCIQIRHSEMGWTENVTWRKFHFLRFPSVDKLLFKHIQSGSDLPSLSRVIIHHFAATTSLVGTKNLSFQEKPCTYMIYQLHIYLLITLSRLFGYGCIRLVYISMRLMFTESEFSSISYLILWLRCSVHNLSSFQTSPKLFISNIEFISWQFGEVIPAD